MCCLKYENDDYEQAKELMPDMGSLISTPDGAGKVVGLNLLERILKVELFDEQRVLEYSIEEIMQHAEKPVQLTE